SAPFLSVGVIDSIDKLWLLSIFVLLLYVNSIIVKDFIRRFKERNYTNKFRGTFHCLFTSMSGNLILGYVFLSSGILFDAINSFFDLKIAVTVIPYTFVIFVLSMFFILSNQAYNAFKQIESLSKQLLSLVKVKDEFLANMSHELRTPLNSIIGFSEVLKDKMFGDLNKKQFEYLTSILASSKHLLLLINDILDISKIEAGKMGLNTSNFIVTDFLDEIKSIFHEQLLKNKIHLNIMVADKIKTIKADENKIKQVFINLISNAMKFTDVAGKINISIKEKNNAIVVSILDTGIGISKNNQSIIFNKFKQIEGPFSKKHEGTGLGLAITKQLIELHKGTIWVKSKLGKGSQFSFSIPQKKN
ncbi:sensor histidine kinase, partial [Candidatus Margulisiibacteriota bacterium]